MPCSHEDEYGDGDAIRVTKISGLCPCVMSLPDLSILPLGGTNSPKIRIPDPLGSHISSILGRKAHNGTMKTFVPPGTKLKYNENICFARRTMVQ